jgi:hypothetical protein
MNDHCVDIDSSQSQRMKCIMCYNIQQKENNQNSTQSWKGLVKYNKDHGTTTMSHHVSSKHSTILALY